MKTTESEPSETADPVRALSALEEEQKRRADWARRKFRITSAGLVLSLSLVGLGLGVWIHPGAGLCAAGALLFLDLSLMPNPKEKEK